MWTWESIQRLYSGPVRDGAGGGNGEVGGLKSYLGSRILGLGGELAKRGQRVAVSI